MRLGGRTSCLEIEESVVAAFVVVVGFLLRLCFQVSLFVKHAVGGSQHDELRAAVQLVAYFFLFSATG